MPATGKPNRCFSGRAWVRCFFEHHQIKTGDLLSLERLGARRYRLAPIDAAAKRQSGWRQYEKEPLAGSGPTVLELFAGCGGLALGFKKAGFQTVLANEWNADACKTLRANITPRVAECAVEEIEKFPQVDVVAGGPPCQGFSNLGEVLPCDPRRQLWRDFFRAVKEASPKVFVMENVPPIIKSQEYIEILRIAKSLGYRVNSYILNAADYGVAQIRKRAIIMGARGTAPLPPKPTHADKAGSVVSARELQRWKTVRDAIGDLPRKPTGQSWHIGRNPTDRSLVRYKCIPAGGNRFDLPNHLKPPCWIAKTKGGTDLFGRLWWDRPSVTIRTEFYKPEKGRYLHPVAHRPITHREAARLQGFPDNFKFLGSKINVGVQIGNAVPPPLAEVIARHLKVCLQEIES